MTSSHGVHVVWILRDKQRVYSETFRKISREFCSARKYTRDRHNGMIDNNLLALDNEVMTTGPNDTQRVGILWKS